MLFLKEWIDQKEIQNKGLEESEPILRLNMNMNRVKELKSNIMPKVILCSDQCRYT